MRRGEIADSHVSASPAQVSQHFRELETEIRESQSLRPIERMLESIVAALPDLVYRLDSEGRVVFMSEAVRKYGYDPDELVGQSIFDLIHPDDVEKARHRINDRRTGDRSTRSLEVRLLSRDRTAVDFELKETVTEIEPTLVVDAQGVYSSGNPQAESFLYTQGVGRDVTERRRVDDALRVARNRMARHVAERTAQIEEAYSRLHEEIHQRQHKEEELAEARREAEQRDQAFGRVRDRVLGMRRMADLPPEEFWIGELRCLGVPIDGISLQFPGVKPDTFTTFYLSRQGYLGETPLDTCPWVREVWESGQHVLVSRERLVSLGLGDWSTTCVLEMPLSGTGSIAVSNSQGVVYDEEMVRTVKAFAGLVAEGVQRARDFEALEESEQRHRSLVEKLPVGVTHTTPEGEILYQNPCARAMLGYTDEELSGLEPADLFVDPADRERLLRVLAEKGVCAYEHELRRKGGRRIWVRGTVRVVRDGATGEEEHHGCIEDVTDRRLLKTEYSGVEEQLRQAQKMEAVGQLTAGIAHNFNNMLQAIAGNLQLALLEAPADMADLLTDADAAARRAGEMIRQLMIFARQGIHPCVKPLDLWHVIGNTAEICRGTFDQKIRLTAESPRARMPVVGDEGMLHQAFLNLCINARDALDEEGPAASEIRLVAERVEVDAEQAAAKREISPGPHVRVDVTDNGPGMDEGTRLRVFDPFFTTKPVDRGTGLGLAMVYGIITQHHGWVECRSEVGAGTTFSVYLPLALEGQEEEPEKLGETPSRVKAGARTILVIDDEDVVRSVARRFLGHCGYRVLEAADGRDGVAVFCRERESVALVLLDLAMPTMSGREALAAMRDVDPEVKVIIFTGDATKAEGIEGDFTVLEKPFDLDELGAAVRRALPSHDS